ncbi:flagellar biosynthesis [bacterium]|nr:flagellar biosynthesis [bacterium]MBT3581036.1 flagellar biosynthesis [bacterium]MBT4552063.1 flagellar biosynthesis [bacterium]MBT5988274.1 flagellar biosynthesis [bacterium]MBT7088216.1 flagellar biosynthesis [bacterium]
MGKQEQIKSKIKKSKDQLSPTSEDRKAIAIRFDVEKDRAPKILAIGKGSIAEEILRVADENKIPLYEDQHLANLLAKLQIEEEIPAELYKLIAEVLAFIYQLDIMAKKREKIQKFAHKGPQ